MPVNHHKQYHTCCPDIRLARILWSFFLMNQLGSHVGRRSTYSCVILLVLTRTLLLLNSSQTKISNFNLSSVIDKNIFKLDISMNNLFLLQISQSNYYLSKQELGYWLCELLSTLDILKQVTTLAKLHDVQLVLLCLKAFKEFNNIFMTKLFEDGCFLV